MFVSQLAAGNWFALSFCRFKNHLTDVIPLTIVRRNLLDKYLCLAGKMKNLLRFLLEEIILSNDRASFSEA